MQFDHRAGVGSLFFFGGLLFVWGSVELVVKKRKLIRRALPIQVHIAEIEVAIGGDDPDHYAAIVEYAVDGEKLRTRLSPTTADETAYKRGRSLPAFYDPLDPASVAVPRATGRAE